MQTVAPENQTHYVYTRIFINIITNIRNNFTFSLNIVYLSFLKYYSNRLRVLDSSVDGDTCYTECSSKKTRQIMQKTKQIMQTVLRRKPDKLCRQCNNPENETNFLVTL